LANYFLIDKEKEKNYRKTKLVPKTKEEKK